MTSQRSQADCRAVTLVLLTGAYSAVAPNAATCAWQELAVDSASMLTIGDLYDMRPFDNPDALVGLALFPDGGVAVARGRPRTEVLIFDPAGRVERVLETSEPARFNRVTGLALASPDTVLVFDVPVEGMLRVSRFLRNGVHVGAHEIRVADGAGAVYQGLLPDGVSVGMWTKMTPIDPCCLVSDSNRIALFGRDSFATVVRTIPGISREGSPVHFSPHPLIAVIGDTIFHSNGVDGLVHAIRRDASTVRSFQLPLEAWSVEEAFARLEPALERSGLLTDPYLSPGTVVPTVSDMLAAPDGRMWVKPYDPATDSHSLARPRTGGEWLIVSTGGVVESRMLMPDGFRPMVIGRDRVAGIMRGEGGEHVAVFTIVPRRPAA